MVLAQDTAQGALKDVAQMAHLEKPGPDRNVNTGNDDQRNQWRPPYDFTVEPV